MLNTYFYYFYYQSTSLGSGAYSIYKCLSFQYITSYPSLFFKYFLLAPLVLYNKNLYHQVNAHYTFPVIVIESDPLGGFKKPVHC